MTIAIIVHGGASPAPAEEADAYKRGCLAALQAGWAVLKRGGNTCDAIEAAIRWGQGCMLTALVSAVTGYVFSSLGRANRYLYLRK
ncbi:MAG: isoaspartyl peptidase/L-asparaginase [Roseiflexaceae bacterium]